MVVLVVAEQAEEVQVVVVIAVDEIDCNLKAAEKAFPTYQSKPFLDGCLEQGSTDRTCWCRMAFDATQRMTSRRMHQNAYRRRYCTDP